jgi:PleD family two-component response regulator
VAPKHWAEASSGTQPDLILLDVMMPDMSGYEVCTRLKANPVTHDIPVIFVTSMSEMENEEHGLSLGAVDYLTKADQHPDPDGQGTQPFGTAPPGDGTRRLESIPGTACCRRRRPKWSASVACGASFPRR